jgi:serine/threonine protein kinase
LLLDKRGDLWVADFGMADVQGDAGLTLGGDLPGTLRFMSPERATGERALVDRRTDIYSLGATQACAGGVGRVAGRGGRGGLSSSSIPMKQAREG